MRCSAVVFDLDDTLYPECAYVMSGFRACSTWISHHLGISQPEAYAELIALFENGERMRTFDRFLDRHGMLETTTVEELIETYRSHRPRISLHPGILEMLRHLRARYRLGLVSDGRFGVQRAKIQALHLEALLDAVVLSDQWGRNAWKPSAIPFVEVLRRLDVHASEAVYIADNPMKDFKGGNRIGMRTIRLRWPDGLHADLEPERPEDAPWAEVGGINELEELLAGIGSERLS